MSRPVHLKDGLNYTGSGGGSSNHLTDKMVANYEDSSISTHHYDIGEQFIYATKLYEATSAISIGDTIVTDGANANCMESDSLTEQIAKKGSADNFIGTRQQWEALTPEEQAKYKTMDFIGDSGGTSGTQISYAEWLQLTPEQQASGDYYIPDVPINSSILPMGGFDNTPTENSLNPVTSDGIYQAIEGVDDRVDTLEDTVGETAIPSDLGTTVTGAMSNIDAYNHYSTSETWTGKYWIDGKKIYCRVIQDTTPNVETGLKMVGGNYNVDTVISYEAYIDFGTGWAKANGAMDAAGRTITIGITSDNGYLQPYLRYFNAPSGWFNAPCNVYFEYTKTTG